MYSHQCRQSMSAGKVRYHLGARQMTLHLICKYTSNDWTIMMMQSLYRIYTQYFIPLVMQSLNRLYTNFWKYLSNAIIIQTIHTLLPHPELHDHYTDYTHTSYTPWVTRSLYRLHTRYLYSQITKLLYRLYKHLRKATRCQTISKILLFPE